jgi:hypothetical protein
MIQPRITQIRGAGLLELACNQVSTGRGSGFKSCVVHSELPDDRYRLSSTDPARYRARY